MEGFIRGGCGGTGGARCHCDDCEEWGRYCYWNHDHGGRAKQFLLFASDDKDSQCIPWEVSSQLRDMIPDSEPIKLETPDGRTYSVKFVKFGWITLTTGWRGFVDANHIEENNPMLFVYRGNSTFKLTMLPGSFVTKAQDDKFLEWAHTIKSGFPLFVAAMDESNVSLNDCHVFKEEVAKIVAPDKRIYIVGAKKHNDDQIVLQSGWDRFVASQCIQQNDFLIFIIEGETRLKVLVLDPSGSEKTFAMGNSSNAREKPPLPPTVTNLSSEDNEVTDLSSDDDVIGLSSDDDEVVGKDTTTSRREKRLPRSCRAKAEKMASTSCPSTKSGHKAGKSNEAGLEAPMSNKIKMPYMLPRRRILTKPQEEKIEEKVRAIGSKFPVFVNVMTAQSVCRPVQALNFSTKYASACLPLEEMPLRLGLEGSKKHWHTTLLIGKYDNYKRIFKGWTDLVLEAGLQEGDICLVELADRSSKGLKMAVHLIRNSEMQP